MMRLTEMVPGRHVPDVRIFLSFDGVMVVQKTQRSLLFCHGVRHMWVQESPGEYECFRCDAAYYTRNIESRGYMEDLCVRLTTPDVWN